MKKTNSCPCKSGLDFKYCCKPYLSIIALDQDQVNIYRNKGDEETILLAWKNGYGPAISEDFYKKTQPFIYRISRYLDDLMDVYFAVDSSDPKEKDEFILETIFALKHNFILSMVAALRCVADGLFLQSGVLMRSALEGCFVLLDISFHKDQLHRFLHDEYKASSALSRIKKYIPSILISWYGYFSANFTHAGPLHKAPYMPRACNLDNWVIVTGIQNLVRCIVAYHIVLERIYYPQIQKHFFWKRQGSEFTFNDESVVFIWSENLGIDLVKKYPPDEEKPNFVKSKRSHAVKA